MEGERWLVSLVGYLGERAPTGLSGFREHAARLSTPVLAELVEDANPVDEPVVHHFAESRRLRYDRVPRSPEGYLVVGEGLCSSTATYGQASRSLRRSRWFCGRRSGRARTGCRSFYAASSRLVERAWAMSAGGDLRYPPWKGGGPRRCGS